MNQVFLIMERSINLKFFTDEEFERCSPSCKKEQCNADSLRRLDRAREVAGIPFVLSSAYRSREHEVSKGRSGTGAHTEGRAFDIRCSTSRDRWLIVHAAMVSGFTRIGIANTFVHLDDSPNLTQSVIWLY